LAEFGGRCTAQAVVDAAAARNAGAEPLGDVGVVVGATREHGLDLSAVNGPVLAPGLGAQGAAPADIPGIFAGLRGIVLPAAAPSGRRAGRNEAARRAAAEPRRDGRAPLEEPAGPG